MSIKSMVDALIRVQPKDGSEYFLRIDDNMVERGARALDVGAMAQFDESYKRTTARAVLAAALGQERSND